MARVSERLGALETRVTGPLDDQLHAHLTTRQAGGKIAGMATAQHIDTARITHVTEHAGFVHPKKGQLPNNLTGHTNGTCGGTSAVVRRFALPGAVTVDEMNARMGDVWPCCVCITTGDAPRVIPELDVPDPVSPEGGCKPKRTVGVDDDGMVALPVADVERWLTALGRKVEVDEVTTGLRLAANLWAMQYTGDFEYMVDMRDAAKSRRTGLTQGQAKGVLNCWRADLARRPKPVTGTSPSPVVATADYTSIPEGKYAFVADAGHVAFVKIDQGKGKWAGRTFATLLIGAPGDWREQRLSRDASQAILAKVAVDPAAAAALFGHTFKKCGLCSSPLSLERSLKAGFGHDCAEKLGAPW